MAEEDLTTEAPDELAAPAETQAEAPEAPQETTEEAPKAHPAHEKLLAELPEAWHAKVTPHLQDYDRNMQQQLEKYSPYKQFIDEGVDPDYINKSVQLARAIAEDPVSVHGNLTKALMDQGLLRKEAEEQASEIMEENAEENSLYEEDIPESIKKQMEAQKAELDAIKGQMSEQELARQTDVELQAINSEFDDLKSKYEVSPAQEQAIIELMEAGIARGEMLNVYQAAKKLVEITGSGFKKAGQADLSQPDAPTVVGGDGGNGVPFESVEIPKDEKGKRQMLADMFKNKLQEN